MIAMAVLIAAGGCNEPLQPGDADPSVESAIEPSPAPVTEPKEEPVETAKGPTRVKFQTTKGDIIIRLDEAMAPVTCKNFLRYVEEGFYDGTIFHRVIKDFMIQGGGFAPGMIPKTPYAPIINESKNGLKNVRGAVAMARLQGQDDSATSQFFVNHQDNPRLDAGGPFGGFTVFGHVVSGMDVVDAIAVVETTTIGRYQNVPVEPIRIEKVTILE